MCPDQQHMVNALHTASIGTDGSYNVRVVDRWFVLASTCAGTAGHGLNAPTVGSYHSLGKL
jgi:hypothetical protein